MDMQVLEINAGSQCTGNNIFGVIGEAMQSSQVSFGKSPTNFHVLSWLVEAFANQCMDGESS